ncbi:MAG: penicillin-binding transpeptidase domain-containing protein [Cellulosilyticaceae bacterium]
MKKTIFILISILFLTGCSGEKYYTIEKEDVAQQEKRLAQQDNEEIREPDATVNEVDYSQYFRGINGCTVFYNPKQDVYTVYDKELCEVPISPYSTFKVITTLMGLENGIIESENSAIAETTLEEAFRKSYVWYYEQIMNELQKERVQDTLNELEYGNRDLSDWNEQGHNTFWIASNLKISPMEQVGVLTKIFEGKIQWDEKHIRILKNLMLVEKNEDYAVYGKTGSAKQKEAWFVGFLEKHEESIYFATKLDDQTQELAGAVAKTITLEIIDTYYR